MAKKQRRKNVENIGNKIDSWIVRAYKYGVLHSTIFHTALFLILALIVTENIKNQHIKLKLCFNDISESSEVLTVKDIDFVEIKDEVAASEVPTEIIPVVDPKIDITPENVEFDETKEVAYTSHQEIPTSELTKVINHNDQHTEKFEETVAESEPIVETQSSEISGSSVPANELGSLIEHIFGNSNSNNNQSANAPNVGLGGNNGTNEIGERLKKAGAKTGDIQISIGWDTVDDIDLHVLFKGSSGQSSYICWMNRLGINGGMLDVDMNAEPSTLTDSAVENVFWPKGQSPKGEFTIGVHNFRNWSGNRSATVTVIIKTKEFAKTIKAVAISGQNPQPVFKFSTANP